MAETRRRWAIDSSVVLGALKDGDGDCRKVLQAIDATPNIQAVASTLLIAECISIDRDPAAHEALDALLASSSIMWVHVTRTVALSARRIGAQHPGLRGADAVHLASAIAAQCEAFFGIDKHFKLVMGKQIEGVLVLPPGVFPGQQPIVG